MEKINTVISAAQASNSRESGFCSVCAVWPISYAAVLDRRASSAAVPGGKFKFMFVTFLKKIVRT